MEGKRHTSLCLAVRSRHAACVWLLGLETLHFLSAGASTVSGSPSTQLNLKYVKRIGLAGGEEIGGQRGIRTPNPLGVNEVL